METIVVYFKNHTKHVDLSWCVATRCVIYDFKKNTDRKYRQNNFFNI